MNLHEFRGTRYSTAELSRMSGVSSQSILTRIAKGWTIEQAVCIPTVQQRRRGVVSNFPPLEGTGAGRSAQEIPEITFSDEAAE